MSIQQGNIACPACGKGNSQDAPFCIGCGRPMPKSSQKQNAFSTFSPTAQRRVYTSTTPTAPRTNIPTTPIAPITNTTTTPIVPGMKRASRPPAIIWATAVGLVLVLIFSFVIYKFGFDGNTENNITSENIKTVEKGTTKHDTAQSFTVDENNPTATYEGLTVNFGEFNLEGAEKVSITKFVPETLQEEGLIISAYEIELGSRTEFNDVITISLPYDVNNLDKSVSEEQSVAGKYFNPTTKEWENIPYTVDTEKKQVNITTTHLSKYSIFEVKNPNSRKAYITGTNINLLAQKDAMDILNEYMEKGEPGDLALEGGFGLISDIVNVSSKSNTFFTLADASYDSNFCKGIDKYTRWAGVGLAGVSLIADISNAKTDEDKRRYVTDLVKNITYSTVDFVGSSFVQVGFVGVFAVDYTLTTFGNAVIDMKLDSLRKTYEYHNKTKTPLKAVDWYKKMQDIYDKNKSDIPQAKKLINKEIDDYVNKFWTLNSSEQNFLADEAGVKKMPYPNADDITKLKMECKENLMNYLQGVFNRLELYIAEEVKADYVKKLDELKKELNKKVNVKIVDSQASGDEASAYTDYTVRFAPLNEKADPNQWTGKIKKDGTLSTSFTVLGHMECGMPTKLEVYKPGDDPDTGKPEFTVDFKVAMPETVIFLKKKASTVVNKGNKLKEITYASEVDYKTNYSTHQYIKYAFARAKNLVVNYNSDNKFSINVPATSFTTTDGYDNCKVTISGFTIAGSIDNQAKYKGVINPGKFTISVVNTNIKKSSISYTTNATFSYSGSTGLAYEGGGPLSIELNYDSTYSITYYDGEVENQKNSFSDDYFFEYTTE